MMCRSARNWNEKRHALALLHGASTDPARAFYEFDRLEKTGLKPNPHYSLHLAECCIQVHSKRENDLQNLKQVEDNKTVGRSDLNPNPRANGQVTFEVTGPTLNQNILMTNTASETLDADAEKAQNDGRADPIMTVEKARIYLLRAKVCVRARERSKVERQESFFNSGRHRRPSAS